MKLMRRPVARECEVLGHCAAFAAHQRQERRDAMAQCRQAYGIRLRCAFHRHLRDQAFNLLDFELSACGFGALCEFRPEHLLLQIGEACGIKEQVVFDGHVRNEVRVVRLTHQLVENLADQSVRGSAGNAASHGLG
jgi:hypothetical protein